MILLLSPLCVYAEDISLSYSGLYEKEDFYVCSSSDVKTYMEYSMITDPTSDQYWFIRENMTVDEKTGLLYDEDGFIGVALGSKFGGIGEKYLFYLENGQVLPLIKIEEKADEDCIDGCYQKYDKSVIEFVIDVDYAGNYFGRALNGFVLQGNFNNSKLFKGEITKIEHLIKKTMVMSFDFSPIKEEGKTVTFDFTEIR